MEKKIFDANDVSKILKCSVEQATEILSSNQLPTLLVGQTRVVLKSEFDKWSASYGGEKAFVKKPDKVLENLQIGANLRKLRVDAKLTTDELAQIMGVTGSAVSHWECNDSNPSLRVLKKYHNLFNINWHILLKETEEGR